MQSLKNFFHKDSVQNTATTVGALAVLLTAHYVNSHKDGLFFAKQNSTIAKSLEKKYTISDEASFRQLYTDAFPLMCLSMFLTEVLVTHPYRDNNKTINTIGLGSYFYPLNGNSHSSEWTKTSRYIKTHPSLRLTGEQSIDLVDGWFRYRENGRIYKEMYKRLKGSTLKLNEFAAIATCMYNNESRGKKVCSYVKKNWQNP